MTIKGQNISNFKLLLSAPPLIDEIPVSVKCCILTLFLWNILHRFATVITGTIDTETQFITTNTFIHSNTQIQIQIVFNFSPVEGYILLCSGKFRGSGGILTEPRSAPELAPVPDSEQ